MSEQRYERAGHSPDTFWDGYAAALEDIAAFALKKDVEFSLESRHTIRSWVERTREKFKL